MSRSTRSYRAAAWLAALWLLAAAGCADVEPEIRGYTLATVELELEAARQAGEPVLLVARDRAEARPLAEHVAALRAEHGPGVTILAISPRDLLVEPSVSLAGRVDPAALRGEVGHWVLPFLHYGDIDGAVRALVRAYTMVLREQGILPPDGPPLTPFLPVDRRIRAPLPERTATWGAPLALAVFAAGLALQRWRRGQDAPASP